MLFCLECCDTVQLVFLQHYEQNNAIPIHKQNLAIMVDLSSEKKGFLDFDTNEYQNKLEKQHFVLVKQVILFKSQ